jgi:peptidoglycan/LPS O-acetylase OafA/YrhL
MPGAIRHTQLDGLRGLVAIAVVIFHSILDRDPTQDVRIVRPTIQHLHGFYVLLTKAVFVLISGETAVVLFFVLSGTVLFESLRQRQASPAATAIGFPIRRFFRLYPVFLLCLMACSVVLTLTGALALPFSHFWRSAQLRDFSVVGASWTLQVEFLAIPLVLFGYWGYRLWGAGGVIGAYAATAGLLATPELRLHALNFHRFASCFAVGLLIPTNWGAAIARRLPLMAFPFILAAMLLARHVLGLHWWTMDLQQVLAGLLIAQLYYRRAGRFGRFFDRRIPQYLGRLSYSVYLFNVIFLLAMERLTEGMPAMRSHPLEWGLLWSIPVVGGAIATAHWMEKAVERPFIALGRKLTRFSCGAPA